MRDLTIEDMHDDSAIVEWFIDMVGKKNVGEYTTREVIRAIQHIAKYRETNHRLKKHNF